jgi:predicted dehydrogenase
VYTSAAELLAGTAVDGVMVAVSEAAHAEAIGAALDAGTAVLYEGPLAATREEIPAMIERLNAARGPTHADIELGFLPVVRRAAELVADRTVGIPQYAEVRLESDWGALPEEDLCKVDHLAPWYVDPLDRVLGRTAARVLTMDGSGSAGRAQAQSAMQLDYGGCWGTFAVNTGAVSGPDMRMAVTGTAGDVRVDLLAGGLRWRSADSPAWTIETCPPIEPILGLPGMHECVRAFLDCIESGSEGEAGRQRVGRLHRLGLAAERSRDTGGWVEVEGT